MLFWLAPNQQIRPPIYSFRQRSQRRKIVFKCKSLPSNGCLGANVQRIDGLLYLIIQAIFIALIVVPIIFKDVAGLTPKSVPFNGVI